MKYHPSPVIKTPRKFWPRGIEILYEDRDLIVIAKAPGLLTVAAGGGDRDRSVHALMEHYVKKGNYKSRNEVHIVHRLDRDTSGILILAKSLYVKDALQQTWDDVEKTYCAVVHGMLARKEGTFSSYLAENAAHRVYSVTDPARGKLSETQYSVVRETNGLSFVNIRLLTGRKHQIRVHFAEAGHPVVGDTFYGRDDQRYKRLALHSQSIAFTHPVSGERLSFESPVPDDIARLVRGHR